MFFWKCISETKITCMPIVCFVVSPLCLKCLLFQIRTHGIRMHVSIRTGVEKGQIGGYKNVCILLKEVLLKLNFKHKGHVYTNCLFYILDNYWKRRIFQFLPCGIPMHIPILTGVQIGQISG